MTAVNELVDKYKKACSLSSDNAASARLGVTRQSIHAWRNGSAWPSQDHIVEMASTVNEDAGAWLIEINAERSEGPVKKEWLRLASRLAATAILVVTFGLLNVQTAHANGMAEISQNQGTLYIM